MTVQQLLESVSSAELTEWIAWYNFDSLAKKVRQEEMSDGDRMKAARALFSKVKKHVSR